MAVKNFSDRIKTARSGSPNPVTKGAAATPWVTTGPVGGSGTYSLARAIGFAKGVYRAENAKEEIHVHEQLKGLLRTKGFYPSKEASMLVPIGTSFLPSCHEDGSDWGEMRKLSGEIREKQAAALPIAHDPEHDDWLRGKVAEKTSLSTNSTLLGGSFVAPPSLGEVIDLQRNVESFSRAGASNVTLPPNGRIIFPKQTGGGTAYWVGENVAITESNPTTGQLSLEAKKLAVRYQVTDEMLRFASPDMESFMRNDMAMVLGLEADAKMFDGVGGTQIKGLLTYPTSTSWTSGTDKVLAYTASTTGANGNTFRPQDFVKMSHLMPDPVQVMPRTFIMRTNHAMNIMSARADAVSAADAAGPFVFSLTRDPSTGAPQGVYGSKLVLSYNVPANRVKSSGTDLTVVTHGAFSDWLIGRVGVMEILANPWETTAYANATTLLRGIQYIDAGPRHLASFAFCDQLLQTA